MMHNTLYLLYPPVLSFQIKGYRVLAIYAILLSSLFCSPWPARERESGRERGKEREKEREKERGGREERAGGHIGG